MLMQWSVVATFAGVLVAASAAAWGIVREQSVVRQLERLTAILKDIEEDDPSRTHIEFVRTDLARRLNTLYRAPRDWLSGFLGWTVRLVSWGALLLAYLAVAITLATVVPPPFHGDGPGATITIAVIMAVTGLAGIALSSAFFRLRERRRRRWLDRHGLYEISGR